MLIESTTRVTEKGEFRFHRYAFATTERLEQIIAGREADGEWVLKGLYYCKEDGLNFVEFMKKIDI